MNNALRAFTLAADVMLLRDNSEQGMDVGPAVQGGERTASVFSHLDNHDPRLLLASSNASNCTRLK